MGLTLTQRHRWVSAATAAGFGVARDLGPDDGSRVAVDVNARGDIAVAWNTTGPDPTRRALSVARGSVAGFAATTTINAGRAGGAYNESDVAVAPDGRVVVAFQWYRDTLVLPNTQGVVLAMTAARGRPFPQPTAISALTGGSSAFSIEVEAVGTRVVIAWEQALQTDGTPQDVWSTTIDPAKSPSSWPRATRLTGQAHIMSLTSDGRRAELLSWSPDGAGGTVLFSSLTSTAGNLQTAARTSSPTFTYPYFAAAGGGTFATARNLSPSGDTVLIAVAG